MMPAMKRVLLALVILLNWNVSAQDANELDIYWVDVEGGAATPWDDPVGFAQAAIRLLTDFAGRAEDPLRHLL